VLGSVVYQPRRSQPPSSPACQRLLRTEHLIGYTMLYYMDAQRQNHLPTADFIHQVSDRTISVSGGAANLGSPARVARAIRVSRKVSGLTKEVASALYSTVDLLHNGFQPSLQAHCYFRHVRLCALPIWDINPTFRSFYRLLTLKHCKNLVSSSRLCASYTCQMPFSCCCVFVTLSYSLS
jgi:hypothetical protein